MPRAVRTPDERAEAVQLAERRARKSYKTDLKKKTRLTDTEIEVVKDSLVCLKVVGYSNTSCAAIVGVSKGQVREIVNDEAFQKRLNKLKSDLPKAAVMLGKAYLVESVQAILHVMRTEKDNALVLRAAESMMDRFGIPKTSRSESKHEPASEDPTGISTNLLEQVRAMPPEIQEKIAGLHDLFEQGVRQVIEESVR